MPYYDNIFIDLLNQKKGQNVKLGKYNPKLNGMTEVLPLFDSHTGLSLADFRKNQRAYGTSIPLPEGFTQKERMSGNTPALGLRLKFLRDGLPQSVLADGFETGWDTEPTMHTGFNESDYLETKSLLLR